MSEREEQMHRGESQPLIKGVENVSYARNGAYILAMNMGLSFAVYGINSILAVYMNTHLHQSSNVSSAMTNTSIGLNYAFALIGGILADSYTGHFKMICFGLIVNVIAFGTFLASQLIYKIHHSNAILIGLFMAGLLFFVIGNGFMKASVSSLLGDQFLPHEDKLRSKFFSWFYLSIQLGSIVSSIGAPIMLKYLPPWILFTVLACFAAAVIPVFMLPGKRYRRVQPQGNVFSKSMKIIWIGMTGTRQPQDSHWLDKAKVEYGEQTVDDVKTCLGVLKIFVPLPLFWAIFFQMYSMWVFQASQMDLNIHVGKHKFAIPAAEVSSINPMIDILLIPLFAQVVYPLCAKIGFKLTDLMKMGLGLLCAVAALIVTGFVQIAIEKHGVGNVSIFWILPQFILVSCAEITLSVTAYEFAYTQSPKNMKGMLTAFWLLTLALGNAIVVGLSLLSVVKPFVETFIMAGILTLTFIIFLLIARSYQYKEEKIEEILPSNEDNIN